MNRKILGIAAIMTVALFLLTPMSAMSSIPAVEEEPTQSVIPQSDFVVNLDENEEVIWIADSVVRDDDIAYITMQTTIRPTSNLPLGGYEPLSIYYWAHRVTARNWWGFPLFFSRMAGYFSWVPYPDPDFYCNGVWTSVIARGIAWRYDAESIETEEYPEPGGGDDYGLAESWTTFVDYLIRREPVIYVWIRSDFPGLSGFTWGGSVYWWGMP